MDQIFKPVLSGTTPSPFKFNVNVTWSAKPCMIYQSVKPRFEPGMLKKPPHRSALYPVIASLYPLFYIEVGITTQAFCPIVKCTGCSWLNPDGCWFSPCMVIKNTMFSMLTRLSMRKNPVVLDAWNSSLNPSSIEKKNVKFRYLHHLNHPKSS